MNATTMFAAQHQQAEQALDARTAHRVALNATANRLPPKQDKVMSECTDPVNAISDKVESRRRKMYLAEVKQKIDTFPVSDMTKATMFAAIEALYPLEDSATDSAGHDHG